MPRKQLFAAHGAVENSLEEAGCCFICLQARSLIPETTGKALQEAQRPVYRVSPLYLRLRQGVQSLR